MKRVDLLYTKSQFLEGGISLRNLDGEYGSAVTAREAGFAPGDKVSIIRTRDLEKLLDKAFRYDSVSK